MFLYRRGHCGRAVAQFEWSGLVSSTGGCHLQHSAGTKGWYPLSIITAITYLRMAHKHCCVWRFCSVCLGADLNVKLSQLTWWEWCRIECWTSTPWGHQELRQRSVRAKRCWSIPPWARWRSTQGGSGSVIMLFSSNSHKAYKCQGWHSTCNHWSFRSWSPPNADVTFGSGENGRGPSAKIKQIHAKSSKDSNTPECPNSLQSWTHQQQVVDHSEDPQGCSGHRVVRIELSK